MGLSFCANAQVTQIDINRIELMPNEPAPYNMRNWAQVAMQYDSFVYDIQKTGQYLPVVTLQSAGVNYPQNPAFGLHTYVGTNNPNGKEAINILPSLVGATLVGVDKTNQFGQNWVLMSQDFFNKNNNQGLYLNNPSTSSGNDWWYDLMPNIYFYQLYDLYPALGGDEAFQFTSIANRFQEAVQGMGGDDKPWQQASMNYRAWDFLQMEPNANGVAEPEAAGAFAWVLYHAWKQTGNPEYLKAAEWSLEFLNDWTSNPSYELQLPYGVYTAAKMNAEINTDYDLEKMVNWTFDKGPLRGWGAVVGNWGGFDVHGLIGEANDVGDDYAFQMNGVQQAAALVPMIRYDKRYARAIGKWMLNLANATRLFYPGFLPGFLQDASAWSDTYDPDRVVGYEALREQWQGNAPFSTGDAVGGGWAGTNLALYGTSSIGYLGAILENTSDPKIFKIDLLKTDFYNNEAYPTYLLFNPYSSPKTVELAVGTEAVDLYETLSESFVLQNVNGLVDITIPADEAIVLTIVPASGSITYNENKMLINDIVVDFMQTAMPFNYAPRIQALAAEQAEVELGDSTTIFAKAFDKDSENLTYIWSTSGGTISGSGSTVKWLAPATIADHEITLIVTDETNHQDTATISLSAVAEINDAPQILEILKSAPYSNPEGTLEFQAIALDSNEDPITYEWSASGGNITGEGSTVNWTAPASEGIYQLTVTVNDDGGLSATKTTSVLVRTFESTAGNLIAWYPFALNGHDISGNQLHGQVSGAVYGDDFFGNPLSALLTDGFNDRVTVENNPILNFQEAITLSCWFKPDLLPEHEIFLLSHGSWQNRWKVSITPEQKVRWTVNTLDAVGDLDSEVLIQQDNFYHLTVTYDGAWMTLYLNGELQAYRPFTGNLRTTSLPLLIAQMLPDNIDFNYKGIIDEVKIFDYALTPSSVLTLYQQSITSTREPIQQIPALTLTPNPASDLLSIRHSGVSADHGTLSVFNMQGHLIAEQQVRSEAATKLAINNWQSGMYIVVLKTGRTILTARFVKL
ncbi:MAG: hypothetical protein DHS20C18_41990 [Saprospiraceae bacterium]|nr:MAG: hypothetical protein DHS20C18_41990 [Saprospiraceae bacterium]